MSHKIPYWASFIWLGAAGLLYLLVGVKVAVFLLRRKRKPPLDEAPVPPTEE